MKQTYFVTGIDTDAGKSYATGFIARMFQEQGKRVITQKLIQTGNVNRSEDIELHRKIMQIPLMEEDKQRLTMPEIYSYPSSPHLAARLENRPVDFEKIRQATQKLEELYDMVLIEGAGGLMVPLTETYLQIDYIAEQNYPLILVTSGKLGSINHTLLSLEAIKQRNLRLDFLAYNLYPPASDPTIQQDTERYLCDYLKVHFPNCDAMRIPDFQPLTSPEFLT